MSQILSGIDADRESAVVGRRDDGWSSSNDVLRRAIFGHLDDGEVEYVIEICREHGLNPWHKHLIAERRLDPRTRRTHVEIITTIKAFRLLALRTNQYGGPTAPAWAEGGGPWLEFWKPTGYPAVAKMGARRLDYIEPVWGIARWETFAQVEKTANGKVIVSEMWERMPDLMLAKCAEAMALRSAFPDEIGCLYTTEEMMQSKNPGRPAPVGVDDTTPFTMREFETRLAHMGLTNPVTRRETVGKLRGEYSGPADERSFYAFAMDRVKVQPTAYGLAVEEVG